MPVHVTVTYQCSGCGAMAVAPEQQILREFRSLSGQGHGIGGYVIEPVKIESVAPEGWVAYDPYTMCTYCPACWESIELEVRRHQVRDPAATAAGEG